MKKTLYILAISVGVTFASHAQKYVVEKGSVSFYSHAAIEDITAENKKASAIFNSTTSEIVFSIPIAEFQFAKSLMQEHFNEKYLESDKFPKASFQGKINGFSGDKSQVTAVGKMLIHGVTRDVEIPGTIEKQGKNLLFKSKFIIKLEDYNVTRPEIMWQKIAEQVEVTVDFNFKPQ